MRWIKTKEKGATYFTVSRLNLMLEREMKNKYSVQKQKICNLIKRLNPIQYGDSNLNTQEEIKFYPRVINNTGVHFTDEEIELLSKGMQ
jgi:hypothetical protein